MRCLRQVPRAARAVGAFPLVVKEEMEARGPRACPAIPATLGRSGCSSHAGHTGRRPGPPPLLPAGVACPLSGPGRALFLHLPRRQGKDRQRVGADRCSVSTRGTAELQPDATGRRGAERHERVCACVCGGTCVRACVCVWVLRVGLAPAHLPFLGLEQLQTGLLPGTLMRGASCRG